MSQTTVRRLLQRQILPTDRDSDVLALYVDPEEAKLDADKNGQLSRSELPKEHKFAAHFDMLDTDKNGTLSAAEFAKGHGM